MGKEAAWVLFFFLCCVLIAISVRHPLLLSDEGNAFLADFLDNDILSVLGFITAVGNAATLSIFLHLNSLEDDTEAKFVRVRRSLALSAVSLVYVFLIAFTALLVKPRLGFGIHGEAIVNSIGIACVFFSLSVLRDLTLTVFGIPTRKRIAEIALENREGKKKP